MKTSSYIDLLVKDLDSHFWKTSDNERNAYHSLLNNANSTSQLVNYKSIHVRDLIDFYIKELEFTPQQFISALNDNRRFIEFLYSSYTSFVSDRRELQEIFEPILRKDIDLFKLALKECLDTHHNLYDNLQNYPESKELAAQIDRNTAEFKILLEIGQEENIFRKLPKDDLYTKNSQYKKLIQENGLMENEAFDEQKLISLFDEAGKNPRNNSLNKIVDYCIFYIKDIVEKFDSPETFNTWAQAHVNNKKDKDGNNIEWITDKDFFNLINKEVNDESKPYQSNLIDQWMDNLKFRQTILSGYAYDFAYLKVHPHKLIDFLNRLSSSEINTLVRKGIKNLNFESSHYDFSGFINKIPMESAPISQQSAIIETIIDFRKSLQNSDDVMAEQVFFSAALNYLVGKSLKSIKASSNKDEEKAQAKLNVLKTYVKNEEIIVGMIHHAQNAINKNIHNLASNLKEVRLQKRELNLSDEFFTNLDSLASSKLEMYFSYQLHNNGYNHNANVASAIENSVSVVSSFGIYPVLDKLNILEMKITKEVKTSRGKRAKYLYDYPAIFEMIENTKDKGIVSWILQEKHLPALKDTVVYKNKNIVEHFSCFINDYGSSKPIIETIFEVMMENKKVFNELVLSKKKTMKTVKELKSDFIQTSLDVATLDNVLKNKDEEPAKKVSRKI